jgi:peroxiredoxin
MRSAWPVLLVLTACATTPSATPSTVPSAGSRASSRLPDFELNTVDGDSTRLSDHVGREVVILSFWDTWCEPCKTELPHLDRIYRAHKNEGLIVLAIAMDDPSTVMQVAPYVRESGFAFPVLLDPSSKAANLYNTHKSAPYTVVIARDGTIASEASGFEPGAEKLLEARLVKLLAAKTP